MNNDADLPNEDASEQTETTTNKAWGFLRQTASKAGAVAGATARKSMDTGNTIARSTTQTSQIAIGKVQRKLGENYYIILEENPLIIDTLSRSSLLIENQELLSTAFNIPWATTLFWTGAAGSVLALQRPIGHTMGELLHYGPGHIKRWNEVNRFMDSVSGVGHRLKFGHSIDYLPQIVEKFGVEGVPAYFMHLLQDFTTVDGIPVVPNAWDIKQALQEAHFPRKIAVGIVSISFASVLGALAVISVVGELWKFGETVYKKTKTKKYLNTATDAIQNRDFNAAIANYQRALEVDRSPFVLMALGQVYMQRASNRLRAHQAFNEAMVLLADRPDLATPYGHAKLSIRGLAGIQSLATADVLADIHPEHWNDHVRDLVNATVFSFSSTAAKQFGQSEDYVPDTIVTPSQFSAAINYYLAAKSACYYPFTEEREEMVLRNIRSALRSLGLMAQYNEEKLREPANRIRQLWAMELLPPDEIEVALATY